MSKVRTYAYEWVYLHHAHMRIQLTHTDRYLQSYLKYLLSMFQLKPDILMTAVFFSWVHHLIYILNEICYAICGQQTVQTQVCKQAYPTTGSCSSSKLIRFLLVLYIFVLCALIPVFLMAYVLGQHVIRVLLLCPQTSVCRVQLLRCWQSLTVQQQHQQQQQSGLTLSNPPSFTPLSTPFCLPHKLPKANKYHAGENSMYTHNYLHYVMDEDSKNLDAAH